MSTLAPSKYALKSLHQEIDLLDRKLAHLLKYETFATDAARKTAADKMGTKRDQLVRAAQQMISDGIEFLPSELPKSLRTGEEKPEATLAAPVETAEVTVVVATDRKPPPSPYAGTSLDFERNLEAYRQSKAKHA